jgi:hypothetical protein
MAGEHPGLIETRRSWHAVAEHVLAPALHVATGLIGLRVLPGGFTTPAFRSPAGVRRVAVEGTDLVVVDDRGPRRTPLTTLREAAAFAEVAPGAPAHVYRPTTPLELDRPLPLAAAAAARLAAWFALVDAALEDLTTITAAEAPTPVQLWPEHFDLATTISEVNYGGSPGDDRHPEPYLYVGPFEPPPPDGFWNESFGASRPAVQTSDRHDALVFFVEGRRLLHPGSI